MSDMAKFMSRTMVEERMRNLYKSVNVPVPITDEELEAAVDKMSDLVDKFEKMWKTDKDEVSNRYGWEEAIHYLLDNCAWSIMMLELYMTALQDAQNVIRQLIEEDEDE